MNTSNPDNLLQHETSPYLLQHSDNPVNWHPWNQQTLDKARKENKPILLSIGYSACHWCHVMAHESFEDESTAKLMNELFINIKVDREERPDLDKIYQNAHSILSGRPGGWPLTVFLTPDEQIPFFAGTYFPKKAHYQLPAFSELLSMVSQAYIDKQDEIKQQNASITEMLQRISGKDALPADRVSSLPLDLARKQLLSEFDVKNGGFSPAPKFPHPAMLERAIRHWWMTRDQQPADTEVLDTALFTLEKMALGGIYDHLAGGFCRYSTDEKWMIPHFEKMLYDNGQLLHSYTLAWRVTKDPLFRQTALGITRWAMTEMQSTNGGYYSATDADSEGEEGKFFVWTPEQIRALIKPEDFALFSTAFGLDQPANFEGKWHLHRYYTDDQLADTFADTRENINNRITATAQTLLQDRSQRIPPGVDDKVLCSWNALMIRAMAEAGRIFNQPELISSARNALDFIHREMWQNNRLLVSYRDGRSQLNAYLDDYAYLLMALIEYLQSDWRDEYLDWACQLADALLKNFEDPKHGGFYFTSHDHEQLIQRNKTFADDAMPSGNGTAALALQRLGWLLAEPRYLQSAERCIKLGFSQLEMQAITHCTLLHAVEEYLNPAQVILIRGEADKALHWQSIVQEHYANALLCFVIPASSKLPASLADKKARGSICAYICEGSHCLAPVTDEGALINYLNQFRTLPSSQ